jgi:hypothetical protein
MRRPACIFAVLSLLSLPQPGGAADSSAIPTSPSGSSSVTATPPPPPPPDPAGGGSGVPGGPTFPDPATGVVTTPPATGPTIVTPSITPPTIPVPIPEAPSTAAVPNEMLVVSRSIAEATALAQALAPQGYTVLRRQALNFLGGAITAFRLPPGQSPDDAAAQLRQDFPQHTVAPNGFLDPAATEAPAAQLYAKNLIGWAPAAPKCRAALAVGLIDTPVDREHPALHGQNIVSRSFLPAGVEPGTAEHGTAVAALLIGDRTAGSFAGLIPDASLHQANVFHRTADRAAVATVERVVLAVDWLGNDGVRLVNMSLETGANPVLDYAMSAAAQHGMILVAAAGNGGKNAPPAFPAAHPAVIAVTAIDAKAQIYKSANRGDYIDLAGPGVDVWTAKAGGGGSYRSGTSFAVPFVIAAIAIERSAAPDLSAKQILAKLRAAARDLGPKGHDDTFGDGLLAAPKSCSAASASN